MAKQYGRWIVERSLSEGGQAHTFLVFDPNQGADKRYVLKRLRNRDRLARFETETRAALELDHQNVVKQVEFDLTGEKPFIVMEYCQGGALSGINLSGWSVLDRLQLFRGICEGVGAAHSHGIVHRDLKPDNIFIAADGKSPVVGDFGLCYFLERGERVTLTGEAVGATKYMAPELEDGRTDRIGPQVDVYSMGKILYWLMAGKVFDREKHRTSKWNLTGDLVDAPDYKIADLAFVNELLDKSVVLEPSKRFSDANNFRANLDRSIWRIQRSAHALDMAEPQICNFCGIGHYKDVGNSMLGDEKFGYHEVEKFGIRHVEDSKWLLLWCNYCGNVVTFRIDLLQGKSPWKFPLGPNES